ncbi:MAG: hypothetical protein A3F72_20185 [Bacteroidetes bacterium RIFCSPLOWO2_12_FULL_35_15]|nr:MAG: hypothetical protein A3F72_20185 [Bacteroidetes bacterium RIFCSPLOWO2_12_FULL_35_15]
MVEFILDVSQIDFFSEKEYILNNPIVIIKWSNLNCLARFSTPLEMAPALSFRAESRKCAEGKF